jgi:general secretion pathway protein G
MSNYQLPMTNYLPRALRPQARRRGFTLIELLLVMFILVVLASIAAPIYFGKQKSSEISAAQAQVSLIETALTNYEADVGDFPSETQGLQALVTRPEGVDTWNGYLSKGLPMDPWGNPYQYKNPGTHGTRFDVWSFGPDKQDGTEDDIGNWTK